MPLDGVNNSGQNPSLYTTDDLNAITAALQSGGTAAVSSTASRTLAQSTAADSAPPQADEDGVSAIGDKPSLDKPSAVCSSMSMQTLAGLSSEAIMTMLGFEERKSAVDSGISEIETKRQQRQEINQERVEKLQEQADKLRNASLWDKIKQVFSYIGMALGAIAALGTLVAGVATGNPLLIAGSALMLLSMTDQIASEASDGKVSLSAGIGKLAEKIGGSDSELIGQIVGSVLSALIGVAGAAMTGVAGLKNAAQVGQQLGHIGSKINAITGIASGIASVGSGTASIASSVYQYQVSNLKADTKDLEAILMRIQEASNMDTRQLQDIMEKAQAMTEGVMEMLEDGSHTLGTVLTGAPSMA